MLEQEEEKFMELAGVVPWGRSLNEYRQMFLLSENDMKKNILGCSDGPACFNAEVWKIGGNVRSVDPIYRFSASQIQSRIESVFPQVLSQVSKNMEDYVWTNIHSVEELGKIRMEAMSVFIADYEKGKKSGRYINASLPDLPFEDKAFDLALCSHYLFLYSDQIDREQHILSMKELCRVAGEVRVYPLLSMRDNRPSPHLEPVESALRDCGFHVSLVPVEYEFQKGATQMLAVTSK